jgi:alpha-tubulin suppressor-like RCC1 family protein
MDQPGSGGGSDASTSDGPTSDACQGCWDLGCQPGNTAAACGQNGSQCMTCQAPKSMCFEGDCLGENAAENVFTGGRHACLTTIDRKLFCWGANEFWQALGAPGPSDLGATLVPGVQEVVQAAVNSATTTPHSCALTITGEVYCWGSNAAGKLGFHTTDAGSAIAPQKLIGKWREIAVGFEGSCAIDDEEHIQCWGDNLGVNESSPTVLLDEGEWGQLSAAAASACAIRKSDRALYCWGGAAAPAPLGGVNWKYVEVGSTHACGIRTDDHLYCWGSNEYGQLGLDSRTLTSETPLEVPGNATWRTVSAGGQHTCGIQSDGSLWCWGFNDSAQLGLGHFDPVVGPQRVGASNAWQKIAGGKNFTCAIDSSRVAYCWGRNGDAGQTTQSQTQYNVTTPTPIRFTD